MVDGIGWRIEIKSHPELTDIGAWRVVHETKKTWGDFEVWKEGDKRQKYGGYYTQEQIKEVVAYAKETHITVFPEIELPGHLQVVFHCYPRLACKDKNLELTKRYEQLGIYFAKSAFRPNISFELNHETKNIEFSIESELPTQIYLTIDPEPIGK